MAGLFLPWEMKLLIKYLQVHPSLFVDPDNCAMVELAVSTKSRLTVDQARKILSSEWNKATLHPNPVIGAMWVWEDDSAYYDPSDLIIPQEVKDQYPGIIWEEGD